LGLCGDLIFCSTSFLIMNQIETQNQDEQPISELEILQNLDSEKNVYNRCVNALRELIKSKKLPSDATQALLATAESYLREAERDFEDKDSYTEKGYRKVQDRMRARWQLFRDLCPKELREQIQKEIDDKMLTPRRFSNIVYSKDELLAKGVALWTLQNELRRPFDKFHDEAVEIAKDAKIEKSTKILKMEEKMQALVMLHAKLKKDARVQAVEDGYRLIKEKGFSDRSIAPYEVEDVISRSDFYMENVIARLRASINAEKFKTE
jgi:hypothetical protein